MKNFAWMVFVAGTLALAGCATEGPYLAVAKPDSPEAAGAPAVLLNSELMDWIAVDHAPLVRRNANGHLEIQVGLRNRTDDRRLQIRVQTLFFNEAGHVLYSDPGSEAAWQILILAPNQTTYYTQQSLTPEAVRYVVRVAKMKPRH
jgi:hypothetical protein